MGGVRVGGKLARLGLLNRAEVLEGYYYYAFSGVSVGPFNIELPIISGVLTVGEELSCSNGVWVSEPSETYSYQWKRNGVDIENETSNTYTLVGGDDNNVISCVVTATNVSNSESVEAEPVVIGDNWILSTGLWDDSSVWNDDKNWID